MNKLFRKVLSMIAVFAMIFSMMTTVKAATITNNVTGHTFEAYQILTGTQGEENSLGTPEWGNGIDVSQFVTDLKTNVNVAEKFANVSTEDANIFYAAMVGADETTAKKVAEIAYDNIIPGTATTITNETDVAAGYYLIVDTTNVAGQNDSLNLALLQATDNIEIKLKKDVPSVEKKVKENTKYTQDDGYGAGYNDVADWNIGDTIGFKLIGTLPDNYDDYEVYKYVFHDTQSAGLTLDLSSVEVYAVNGDVKTDITGSFTKDETTDPKGFTVTCNDLKSIQNVTINSDTKIVVEYNATLNKDAVIGLPGNPNEVYLEFSNNPNYEGAGEGSPTGNTPEDKVIVFTYKLDVTKVDSTNSETKLEKAEFKLKNAAGKWATVENGKVTGWVDDQENGTTLTTDTNGLISIAGLDDGTYTLVETKAPDGYNITNAEIPFTITATTSNGQTWENGIPSDALTALKISYNSKDTAGDTSTGTVGMTVTNTPAGALPETGGIGNYVFYGAGSILMLSAACYFVMKKRN